MMTLLIPDAEYWNEQEEIFIYRKGRSLRLEHSLVSLSKWESKHEKPFLSKVSSIFIEDFFIGTYNP